MMHRLASTSSSPGTRARLLCNELLANRKKCPPPQYQYQYHHQYHQHHALSSHCHWPESKADARRRFSRPRSSRSAIAASPSSKLPNYHYYYIPTRRSFLTSTDLTEIVVESENNNRHDAPPQRSPLPVPPMTPSNVSAVASSSLISHSAVESLQSLPECRSVLDLLNNGSADDDAAITTGSDGADGGGSAIIEGARAKEARSDLRRARDILRAMPELERATHLLEADLLAFRGKFESALESLARYEHHRFGSMQDRAAERCDRREKKTHLQFLKAKLYVHSGRLNHALSEYEYLLEEMEAEAEEQMERRERKDDDAAEEEEKSEEKVDGEHRLPVIHGAAALTGVGVTKLLMFARGGGGGDAGGGDANSTESESVESMETVAEMLLESREEALLSPKHYKLAIDLGVAACISLTNVGVAQYILNNDSNRSIEIWKKGLDTLDAILQDSVLSATIIPNYELQCMESIRARLFCNISWALLEREEGESENGVSDETLKDASDAAKKALDIYDELINGAKILRDDGTSDADNGESGKDDDGVTEEDATTSQKLEYMLKEQVKAQKDASESDLSSMKPKDLPLSPLWTAYHRCESARALGLLARCYAGAGAAVTAEGLFKSALDASSSYPLGQSFNNRDGSRGKGVPLSSPNLGIIGRDVRFWYAKLCDNWENRKGDADRLRSDASRIEDEGVLKGFARGDNTEKRGSVSSLESSLWLFSPLDFER